MMDDVRPLFGRFRQETSYDVNTWFPLDRGGDFSILVGPVRFALGPTQIGWDLIDPTHSGISPPGGPNKWQDIT